ncbi:MAG: rRNA maturation RNase YbeY [Calditrichia bacterium]
MKISVINSLPEKIPTRIFKQLLERIVEKENIPLKELSVILVDNEYLRKLHRDYLQDDSYTDVMTFDLSEGRKLDAEIYASWDRAVQQSAEFKVSPEEEGARLIIHGLLHLQGWDDAGEEQRKKMHMRENELISQYWRPLLLQKGIVE